MKPGLLIAAPAMRDSNFARTVVLVCQYDEEGALGLIINRDGPVSIGTVVERLDLESPIDPSAPTWWGGPVGESTGFVIWRGTAEGNEGWNVGDDVAVSPSVDRLGRLIASGQRFCLALGYAGWGPGQLEDEITTGSWIYADVDAELLFDTPRTARYERALAQLGLTAATVTMTPGEA